MERAKFLERYVICVDVCERSRGLMHHTDECIRLRDTVASCTMHGNRERRLSISGARNLFDANGNTQGVSFKDIENLFLQKFYDTKGNGVWYK